LTWLTKFPKKKFEEMSNNHALDPIRWRLCTKSSGRKEKKKDCEKVKKDKWKGYWSERVIKSSMFD